MFVPTTIYRLVDRHLESPLQGVTAESPALFALSRSHPERMKITLISIPPLARIHRATPQHTLKHTGSTRPTHHTHTTNTPRDTPMRTTARQVSVET